MRQFGAIAVSLFIAIAIFCSISLVYAANPGSPAPDFTLTDISGKKVSLSELKGKVVLLNFWATWCGPCRAEMPGLNKLYQELREKGLVVLAISVDASDKPVKEFMKDKKFSFPVLLDTDKEVSFDDYAVMGLPTTIIIDRKGLIAEKVLGEREWDTPQMKEKITKLLMAK